MGERDRDIHDAMRREKARLKPAQAAAKKKRDDWEAEAERLLNRGTEEEMIEAIRRAGMEPGSPEGQNALRVWRENRR